ncbi:LysE family translocator [uncultured Roseibium sp.]|uniref:LysE family translocator n=1 Tax=uncultured Roseibium sp. TaxID=1936171 RepID=UPI0026142B1A|nr:LysE family translocator [uncultured Roseibium sp.]
MSEQVLALILFAVVATSSPGGATTLVTASGARFGYRRSLPLILGIALALATLVAVSGTSFATTIIAAPSLHLAAKGIGSIYLLWLAAKIGLAGPPAASKANSQQPIGFLGGAMLLLVNPKAWAMALAVASSFSQIAVHPTTLGFILATIFAVAACLSLSVWALAGSVVARTLSRAWHWHMFNWTMAVLLLASIVMFWV